MADSLRQHEANEILQRAATIELREGTPLDLAALRDAAGQAGISAAAFDQAVAEQRDANALLVRRAIWRRRLLIAALLGIAGLLALAVSMGLTPWALMVELLDLR